MSTAAVRLQRRASEGVPACVWQVLGISMPRQPLDEYYYTAIMTMTRVYGRFHSPEAAIRVPIL